MGVVADRLLDRDRRPEVIKDCVALVDSEVASKKGVTGMMIKGGYKAFKTMKPRIVPEAVDHLLDDFAPILDRHYEEFQAQEGASDFAGWAVQRDETIADDMLKVTDEKIERSDSGALKKIYKGLRNIAKNQVTAAVPGIASIILKYVG